MSSHTSQEASCKSRAAGARAPFLRSQWSLCNKNNWGECISNVTLIQATHTRLYSCTFKLHPLLVFRCMYLLLKLRCVLICRHVLGWNRLDGSNYGPKTYISLHLFTYLYLITFPLSYCWENMAMTCYDVKYEFSP